MLFLIGDSTKEVEEKLFGEFQFAVCIYNICLTLCMQECWTNMAVAEKLWLHNSDAISVIFFTILILRYKIVHNTIIFWLTRA